MRWLLSGLFVMGFLLASSDGPYFPIVNFIGVALIGVMAILANTRPEHGENLSINLCNGRKRDWTPSSGRVLARLEERCR